MLAAVAAVALAGAPTPPTAAAQAVPVIDVDTTLDVGYPRQVPAAASGQTAPISFTVSSSEPVANVVVTAYTEDGGLTITNPTQNLATLSAVPQTVTFNVRGATAGLHELFVDVTSAAVSASASLPHVWTSGSPLFASKDQLEPTTFGWQGTDASGAREVRMLTILPGGWAYSGLPRKGTPKCKAEGGGCFRYAYNEDNDVLQVGTGIIGALFGEENPPGLFTEGLATPGPGQLYGTTSTTGPSQFAGKGTKLDGTYAFSTAKGTGITSQRVSFKDGKFKLQYAVNGGKQKSLKGTYSVRNKGKITFRKKTGKVVQRGTLLVLDKASAEHGAFTPGIWLVLSGKKGSKADGNLLLKQ